MRGSGANIYDIAHIINKGFDDYNTLLDMFHTFNNTKANKEEGVRLLDILEKVRKIKKIIEEQMDQIDFDFKNDGDMTDDQEFEYRITKRIINVVRNYIKNILEKKGYICPNCNEEIFEWITERNFIV